MSETGVRFAKLIVEDKMDSNVIYVTEERVAQIGEFLDLPGGYRYKVLDNTHDGSLVVEIEPRKGLGWTIARFLRMMLMMDNRPLRVGSLLLVEENHDDPLLQQYYAYMKRDFTLDSNPFGSQGSSGENLPPAFQPLPVRSKNTIYLRRMIAAWTIRIGWTVLLGAVAVMYIQSRNKAALERQQAEARVEEERRIAETFKRQQELESYNRTLAEAIAGGKNDPTAQLLDKSKELEASSSFDEAEKMIREALKMRRSALGDEHVKVAETMETLANLLEHKGAYEEAEKLKQNALEIRRKLSGEEDRTIAMSVRSLASTQRSTLHYEEALAHYEDALRLARQFLKDEPIELARTIEGLSGLVADMGDMARAEELAKEALDLRMKATAENSLERAEGLENMGMILRAKKDYAKAEEYLGQSLVIRAAVLGEKSYGVSDNMLEYALTLFNAGESKLADEIYKEAVAAQRKHFQDVNPAAMPAFAPDIAAYAKQVEDKRASELARREQILAERAAVTPTPQASPTQTGN